MPKQPTKQEILEKIAQLHAEAQRLMAKASIHAQSRKLVQQASILEEHATKLEDALTRITGS